MLGACSRAPESSRRSATAQSTVPASDSPAPILWRLLGEWSGRASLQTESFTSDTGYFRIVWKTTAASGAAPPGTPAAFRLAVHSAISGRPLATVADVGGPGGETAYIHEDPRVFYMVVEASGLDWRFTVEEGAAGARAGPRNH